MHSEDSDQSGRMPRLSLHWAYRPYGWFCHEAAQFHLFSIKQELEAALEDVQSKLNDARDTELKLANATTAIRAEMEEKLSDKDEKIEALKFVPLMSFQC